jgi:hypothetical protein
MLAGFDTIVRATAPAVGICRASTLFRFIVTMEVGSATCPAMPDVVLATINARYIHASLGLRYLFANLGSLRARAAIAEFTLDQRSADIAEQLLTLQPRIVGLGVYIWNAAETTRLVDTLKQVAPQLTIVLGGPEVSHEHDTQPVAENADYIITGQADLAFAELCATLLAGERPAQRVIQAPPPPLTALTLPYRFYSDEDIAHRLIYVEASRGCPFRCEFCLSSLDRTATPLVLDRFLEQMDELYRRGTRHFKFVDRTFNLSQSSCRRILEFFLQRLDDSLFLHFELIPDRLPDGLKQLLSGFPSGSLQLEVGVQTFNPQTQALISRRQDNAASEANLRWLREHTHAHLHVDLIAGLPGEDIASFGAGFERLYALRPHEIQVGILKRLRGAPISRHSEAFQMRFASQPPYPVISTASMDFLTLQRLVRFARYWDLIGNSGRFTHTLPLLLGDQPFWRFLRLSDWLYAETRQTHRIALPRLFALLQRALTEVFELETERVLTNLARDCKVHGLKGCPGFLHPWLDKATRQKSGSARGAPSRQARHLQA